MTRTWDYRYELINFQRHADGSVSYQTRSKGEIPINLEDIRFPSESSLLKMTSWRTARELAEKTEKDVVVYVVGKKIISRIRKVCRTSF